MTTTLRRGGSAVAFTWVGDVANPQDPEFVEALAEAFDRRHKHCKPGIESPAPPNAPRRCVKCGLAENEHHVRHPFVGVGGGA